MMQVPDLANLNIPDNMRAGRPQPDTVESAGSQKLRPAGNFLRAPDTQPLHQRRRLDRNVRRVNLRNCRRNPSEESPYRRCRRGPQPRTGRSPMPAGRGIR